MLDYIGQRSGIRDQGAGVRDLGFGSVVGEHYFLFKINGNSG